MLLIAITLHQMWMVKNTHLHIVSIKRGLALILEYSMQDSPAKGADVFAVIALCILIQNSFN